MKTKLFCLICSLFCLNVIVGPSVQSNIPIIMGFYPYAVAPDQTVNAGDLVSLNGLNSFAADLSLITYQWTQVSGTPVVATGTNTGTPTFIAPVVGKAGDVLVFQLVVSDGTYISDPIFVYIYILYVNHVPVANAGSGQSVLQNTKVTLDGSGSSDADGDSLTYNWAQSSGPNVTLNLTDPVHPSFQSPSVAISGATIVFSLTVSDGQASSAAAFVNILVNNPDRPPVASAGANFTANERTNVYLNGSGSSDPDGDAITYNWTQVSGPIVNLQNQNTANPNFIAPEVTVMGATLVFQLVVSDQYLQSAPAKVSVQIQNVNRAPVASAGLNQVVGERTIVNLNGTASFDPDGDPLTFSWQQISGPPVILSSANIPNPNFVAPEIPLAGANLVFVLTVSDGQLATTSAPIKVFDTYVNRAPIAIAGNDQSINMQTLVTLDGSGSYDPDGDPITYTWLQISGPNVSLNVSNPLHPTFTAPVVGIDGLTVTLSLVVSDGKLLSDASIVNIGIMNVNHAPIASAGNPQTVASGAVVSLSASDSYDPDGDPITFSWSQTSGPVVNFANPTSALPSFTAPIISSGSSYLTFVVLVSDGRLSASASVVITVQPVNHRPIANAGYPQTVQAKMIATLDGSGSYDPDGDPITYAWTQTSGPIVPMDLTNPILPRIIAPDVTAQVQLAFSLVVSDSKLLSVPATVTVTVKPPVAPPSCNLAQVSSFGTKGSKKGKVVGNLLWPPNHKMQQFSVVGVFASGHESDPGNSITISGITQDEPTNGLGDGDTPIDGIIKPGAFLVRRERQGGSNGRVYTIKFKATNSIGTTCTGSLNLCVPKSAANQTCTEDNVKYDSTK